MSAPTSCSPRSGRNGDARLTRGAAAQGRGSGPATCYRPPSLLPGAAGSLGWGVSGVVCVLRYGYCGSDSRIACISAASSARHRPSADDTPCLAGRAHSRVRLPCLPSSRARSASRALASSTSWAGVPAGTAGVKVTKNSAAASPGRESVGTTAWGPDRSDDWLVLRLHRGARRAAASRRAPAQGRPPRPRRTARASATRPARAAGATGAAHDPGQRVRACGPPRGRGRHRPPCPVFPRGTCVVIVTRYSIWLLLRGGCYGSILARSARDRARDDPWPVHGHARCPSPTPGWPALMPATSGSGEARHPPVPAPGFNA